MSSIGARVLGLATRLGSHAVRGAVFSPPAAREVRGPASSALVDRAAMESAYRHALRWWFELTAQGPAADRGEVARLYQELVRLIDEVGEPTATVLRRQWAREWWEETGVCPFCGEQGPYHEPENGGNRRELNPAP